VSLCSECGLPVEACNQMMIYRLAIRRAVRFLESETVRPIARVSIATHILKEALNEGSDHDHPDAAPVMSYVLGRESKAAHHDHMRRDFVQG
jgi:hypothetical protein